MAYYEDNNEELVEQTEPTTTEEVIVEEAEAKENVQPIKNSKNKKNKKGAGAIKATISETKKVSWPGFKKVVKQTAVVLSVTAVFLVVVFGIDYLLSLLYNLLVKNI